MYRSFLGLFWVSVLVLTTTIRVVSAPTSSRTVVRGGVVVTEEVTVTEEAVSIEQEEESLKEDLLSDTLSRTPGPRIRPSIHTSRDSVEMATIPIDTARRGGFFSDSVGLSRMCWTAAALPGYGQIYNKQYWKLPILYGSLAAGITLFSQENKRYKPLKAEYDEITMVSSTRTEYLNSLQSKMIASNTRRQLYLGATIASYIYFLGDAALNYSTGEVSHIKRATTLATICPGAGQIYNKQYWKVPFVVGGFAAMIYVVDWNNRGYQRFKKAYTQIIDYENNPDDYPDGSPDEFNGRYTADYMQSLRDSYRRNRDMSVIFLAGLYILQIVDAHVDAHLKDYDISDELSMEIEPLVSSSYSPSTQNNCVVYGFNVGFKF